jgi:hypothetical protein
MSKSSSTQGVNMSKSSSTQGVNMSKSSSTQGVNDSPKHQTVLEMSNIKKTLPGTPRRRKINRAFI